MLFNEIISEFDGEGASRLLHLEVVVQAGVEDVGALGRDRELRLPAEIVAHEKIVRELGRHIQFGVVVGVPFVAELPYVIHHVMNIQRGSFQENIAQRDSGLCVAVHIGNGRNTFLVVFTLPLRARHVSGHAPHVDIAEISADEEKIGERIADAEISADSAVILRRGASVVVVRGSPDIVVYLAVLEGRVYRQAMVARVYRAGCNADVDIVARFRLQARISPFDVVSRTEQFAAGGQAERILIRKPQLHVLPPEVGAGQTSAQYEEVLLKSR